MRNGFGWGTHDATDEAERAAGALVQLFNPNALQGLPVPERQWLVEYWIPATTVTALYGDGGTGKSLLAQMLLTCCATRRQWLGLPTAPVACNVRLYGTDTVVAIQNALVTMNTSAEGRELLATLRLDGFTPGDMSLFEGIAQKYRVVLAQA